MDLTATQAREAIKIVLGANLCPMVTSSPGIGKSDIIKSIASDFNLTLIDLRLSQEDPTSLLGFPTLINGRMDYAPPKHFPLKGIDKPDLNKKGWLLFLDEFNSASLAVQASAYKLILDRQVGEHSLCDNVFIVAAGNKQSDRAVTNKLSTAMQSRLIHISLIPDHREWVDWALNHNIDQRLISFIKARPELLHSFDPKHNDQTFSCPRTLEFASKILRNNKEIDHTVHAVLAGTISMGPATEFKAFCTIYNTLPTIEELISDPTGTKIKEEVSVQYALTTLISHNINQANIEPLMQVVSRLPIEFQIVTLKDIFTKHPHLKVAEPINGWLDKNSNILF